MNSPKTSEDLASLIAEISGLYRNVFSLEGSLRKQREALKQRGMSLPPGTLQGIQEIGSSLDAVVRQIEEVYNELLQLRTLHQTAEAINASLDLDEVLNFVLGEAVRLIHAERIYLALQDLATGELTIRAGRTASDAPDMNVAHLSQSVIEEVSRTGVTVLTSDALSDDQWNMHESVIAMGLTSILCVPLTQRGDVVGVIYADNRAHKGIFGQKEQQLLSAFANQAAVAIENAQLFENLRQSLAEVTSVKSLMDNVFASIGSGVITTDAENHVITINEAAEQLLALPSGDANSALGKSLDTVLPLTDAAFQNAVHRIQTGEIPETVMLETRSILPNHVDQSILHLTLSPLRNSAWLTQGGVIVIDDLTELRRREDQLRAVRRYLTPAMVDNIQSIDQLGLGGERREITVMFIDVRDFARFPAATQAGELMQQLNQYLTVAVDAISAQEGVIDKYMANEVMALFNTQLNPTEDHAWRAIQAALDMAARFIEDFYPSVGESPAARYFRVGIHTGIATLGNTGSVNRKDFTAIGDTVNLAHRILENAEPGQILVSREAFEHCQSKMIDCESIELLHYGDLQVRNRQQPVSVYTATPRLIR